MKITIFDDIFDEREAWKVIHELQDILILSLCAILCGAEDYEAIEEYGKQKKDFLRQFLNLEGGIPSSSTIKRIFRYLDPSSLVDCLKRNAQQVLELRHRQCATQAVAQAARVRRQIQQRVGAMWVPL